MTDPLFRADAYRREAPGWVAAINARCGVVLDASLFYPTGGGQPGDSGAPHWAGGEMAVATCVKGEATRSSWCRPRARRFRPSARSWFRASTGTGAIV